MLVFAASVIFMFFGISIGLRMRSRTIDSKKQEVLELMTEVRKKNNDMLSNFSKIAHATSNTEGQWTEVDDFLMPMWME